jgi:2-polyprenyl-3-methyl-5-hydroxy-6-metoxy-1,4-benzoquinol methylase
MRGGGVTEPFDREYWDRHYESHASTSHARVNAHVVDVAERLPVGAALDVGCGEGGDALWLAARGWRVTAMDVSPAVLHRARQRAPSHDPSVQALIHWLQADLVEWQPRREGYDLVSAQYVHVPAERLMDFARRLLDAVAPGGSLVVADHAHEVEDGLPQLKDHPLTDAVLSALKTPDWAVHSRAESPRNRDEANGHEHADLAVDHVVTAVRNDSPRA